MTIEMIMYKCGRSLIEPSAVSAPMDFLTSEAEYRRVWQVRVCGELAMDRSYRVFHFQHGTGKRGRNQTIETTGVGVLWPQRNHAVSPLFNVDG